MTAATQVERSFTITRRLDAPRELVFQAWTDPDQLAQWFAGEMPSQGIATTVDLRVGGCWRLHMIEDENRSYMTGGIYHEIVPPEKLVFSFGAIDGWPQLDPSNLDDAPLVTITLDEMNGATEMVLQVAFADRLTDDRVREWLATGMTEGWNITLDRLAPYLHGMVG
ncbi:SRPBCC domain-containing protein [Microlunatus panaciterrae]|uniref:Uncharacterized protein YndB with AHSA1/START domain n=1 Tax=Microlunatus panaciterrae TaxID=400768 RepID=A0ABS2RJS0_9ACTN|nr:SRPBCC domain-containing protein [Microlunatus panaciterrae]MBM7799258.1 uncharacterized protein YndB with AHSA1/START domain [Microlunatus panaciterrae]